MSGWMCKTAAVAAALGLAVSNADAVALPDVGFGLGGVLAEDLGAMDEGMAIAIQSDGKIVAAGTTGTPTVRDTAVIRLTPTGDLDPTFGTGGVVVTDAALITESIVAVAVQPDGKILVAGSDGEDWMLLRYTGSGTLDPTFGTGGKVITDFGSTGETAFGLAIQTDGKIVATGSAGGAIGVARYTAAGAPDLGFAGTGTTTLDPTVLIDIGRDVLIQPDDKIVVAGNAGGDLLLARLLTGGTLDVGFGGGGIVADELGDTDGALSVILQGTSLVVAGSSGADAIVARYDASGAIDGAFGTSGVTTIPVAGGGAAVDVAEIPGGLVALAKIAVGPDDDFVFLGFDADGDPDPGFAGGGMLVMGTPSLDTASGLAVDGGAITAVGFGGDDFVLARALVLVTPVPAAAPTGLLVLVFGFLLLALASGLRGRGPERVRVSRADTRSVRSRRVRG